MKQRKFTIYVAAYLSQAIFKRKDISWMDFCERLKKPHRSSETLQEFLKMPKEQQGQLKDLGGFVGGILKGGKRRADLVEGRDLLTLDLDDIPAGKTEEVLSSVQSLGCSAAVYSTRKHQPEAPRLRVVIPTDRTLTPDEYEPAARHVAKQIGFEYCDPVSFRLNQIMFWPSVCKDGEYILKFFDGDFIGADSILSQCGDWKDAASWPISNRESDTIKQEAQQDSRDLKKKRGYVDAFCRTYTVRDAMEKFLPGVYEPTRNRNRFTYSGGTTSGGAVLLYKDQFLYTHHHHDPCYCEHLVNAFDLVRIHKFEQLDVDVGKDVPLNKYPSYLAMKELCRGLPEVMKNLKLSFEFNERYDEYLRQKLKATEESGTFRPEDFTDLGQAKVFGRVFAECACFVPGLDPLVFTGDHWEPNAYRMQKLSQILVEKQKVEAMRAKLQAEAELEQVLVKKGVRDLISSEKDPEIKQAQAQVDAAEFYLDFAARKRQSSAAIRNTLTEAAPRLSKDVSDLDADPFVLNTPGGLVDLRTGSIRKNLPADLCTRITAVAPSSEGLELFENFLDSLTQGDQTLVDFLQQVVGMAAVGKVFEEKLVLFYGSGGNGKSTFTNLVYAVLGDYSGALSPECMTVGYKGNAKAELAELRGKRFVLAPELSDGQQLDTGTVKKICSTDIIHAEPKYKPVFDFVPSHSVIMTANSLPQVAARDAGFWDRVVVVPFLARLRDGENEVKNYADHLFQECGGAVLSWIVEGARNFIEAGYRLFPPAIVQEITGNFQQEADTLTRFLSERCERGSRWDVGAQTLLDSYLDFCNSAGEFPFTRQAAGFKAAMLQQGFIWKRTKQGGRFFGLRIMPGLASPETRLSHEQPSESAGA